MRAVVATQWRRTKGVAVVDRGERVVAMNLEHLAQPPLVFADTAAQIWRALAKPRDERELILELAAANGLEPKRIADDVRHFLAELSALGFVTAEGGS